MTDDQRHAIRMAHAYVAGLLLLREAERAGTLADPGAVEAEIMRTLDTLDEVLRMEKQGGNSICG